MMDLKPYGAFVENTIRPMIEEAHTLLSELRGYGLYFCKEDVFKLINIIANKHLKAVIIQSISNIIITGFICWTLWMTRALFFPA